MKQVSSGDEKRDSGEMFFLSCAKDGVLLGCKPVAIQTESL